MRKLAVRRALAAAAAAAVAGLLVLPAPSDAAQPTAYSVTTTGAAVRVLSTQQPAFSIATGDLLDQTLGLVSSTFGASTSESRAASYYPGDLLAQAGQLVCGQFGPCPVEPPAYPLLAEASWPTVRRATASPAGPLAGTATATAAEAGNAADAAASSTTTGSSAGGLRLGGVTSSTSTEARADGLRVHVFTALHQVSLGPLAIHELRVWDDVVVPPGGRPRSAPGVAVTGATVAGAPVRLGAAPLPALAAQGLSVRLPGTESAGARSGATGVRIDVSLPVRGVGAPVAGLPSADRTYVGSVVLGQVEVVAARDDALDLPVLPAGSSPSPAVVSPAAPGVPVPGARGAGRPAAAPGPVTAGPPTSSARLRVLGLDALDLQGVYSALAVGAVTALGASRLLSRRAWS